MKDKIDILAIIAFAVIVIAISTIMFFTIEFPLNWICIGMLTLCIGGVSLCDYWNNRNHRKK